MKEQIDRKNYPELSFLFIQFLSVAEEGFEEGICGYALSQPQRLGPVLEEIAQLLASPYPDQVFVDFLREDGCAFLHPDGSGRLTLEVLAARLSKYHNTAYKITFCFLLLDTTTLNLDQDIRSVRQRYSALDRAALIAELQQITIENFPEEQAHQLFIEAGREALLGEKTAKAVLHYILEKLQDEASR